MALSQISNALAVEKFMQNIYDLLQGDLSSTRCVIRVDYNCPLQDGKITDTTRIDKTIAGLKQLLDAGARLVLCSHLGRPKGQVVDAYSLQPVAAYLSHVFGRNVPLISIDTAEKEPFEKAPILLLENLRFFPGEEGNDTNFAQHLAQWGDVYINDAFSCAHRAHASTHAITRLLPAYAGALLDAEVQALQSVLDSPNRPVAAVVGGAKISTKLEVLEHLVQKTDHILLGGGMANTFAAARGIEIGKSICEPDLFETARAIEKAAHAAGCTFHLPVDGVIASEFKAGAEKHDIQLEAGIAADQMMLDIGPETVQLYTDIIKQCRTILWNGPMGAFELEGFSNGTYSVAQAVAHHTSDGAAISVAGGGDTVAALKGAGVDTQFSYVSLAGGAFLEWIEGKELPGIAALQR